MKFRVERDVLADAVAWAARSLSPRPMAPVLSGILLEAGTDGPVTLSSFDYEVSARVEIPATVSEGGSVLISGRLLADIARSLPDAPVDFEQDGAKVTVRCGNARFALATMPVEDYPELPAVPNVTGSIDATDFAVAVNQVVVAAGRDDTLPTLTGVRVEIEGDTITLAATDRYRLAVREIRWKPASSAISLATLIPARSLSDIAKALSGAGTVDISIGEAGEGIVGFVGGGRRATTRLIDGEFPKYRSLLPDQSQSTATVSTAALVDSVKRVSLVAERHMHVRLSFTQGQVTLEAGTGDEASASESIDGTLDGEDITIAFNPQYLLDGLGAIDAGTAALAFTQSTKPAVITAAGEGSTDDYRYLLMPVRLAG